MFDRRHRQQQVLGGFLRSLAAREGERHLELPLAQAAQRIRRQVGRGSTARLELAAGLREPGLRSELGEAGERALEMFHGLGGSADFPEPTAVGKERSGVLEGADHVASVGQRVAKEPVDRVRTRKQSAAACQGRERRRPFRLAGLLLEDRKLALRVGGSPRADESLDQIARAMGRHGRVAPALLELRLAYLG